MKFVKTTLIALLFCSSAVMAEPASESSLKELLSDTKVEKFFNEYKQVRMQALVEDTAKSYVKGKPTASQQRAIDKMQKNLTGLIDSELGWQKLVPIFVSVYQGVYTQDEVNQMLAFYKTPEGESLLSKMPALLGKVRLEIPKVIDEMSPQLEKIIKDYISQIIENGDS